MTSIDRPYNQRLNDSVLADGFDQLRERIRAEILTRLQWAWGDAIETDAPIFSASSTAAIPGAGAGWAAMSALRPLPSAIFAIAQRLSEATPQRKPLVAPIWSTH